MFLCVFTFCEILVCILLIFQSYAINDGVKNSTVYESEMINYTIYNSFFNDSDENISVINQVMNDFAFNKSSVSNISVDVATELESTISVTEDSDNSFRIESNRELFLFLTPDEDMCNCDLSLNVCDINCCCDSDCSEEDIQVFSECFHQVLTPDENYCYQKNIILRNNTVYKMVKNPNNAMFCIVHDNFKHHLRFKDMPVLKSHRDVITVLKYKYKNTYSWDVESKNIYDSRELRAGNLIYIDVISNKKIISSRWRLPSPCLSDVCSCHEDVRYLNNFKSSCSHVIKNLEVECEYNEILSGNKFADFCISQQSATTLTNLIIHTKMVNSNSSDDADDYSSPPNKVCANKNTKKPKRGFKECENVVKHIHFTVEQDGINGIAGVFVDFQYANLLLGNQIVITQSYSVDFVWSNVTDVEEKSGNPGYQIGLPVVAATNGSNLDLEQMSKTFYGRGLSVLAGDSSNFCTKNRETVKFGKNLKSGCTVKHNFTDCESLQNRISDIFLGPSKGQIFVGIFGNANISNRNDWIEVYNGMDDPIEGKDCFVSLGLKIHIIYAAVGTVANPQYKIVGVRYLYTKRKFIDLICAPSCRNIPLSTSVSFFDVTQPTVEHYAKVPSIKASLPSDFFYPFSYGQCGKSTSNAYLILIMFLCFCFFGTEFTVK